MQQDALKTLSELASDAHGLIQQAYEDINPVVEVRQGMRESGFPADVMTIDCLRSRRRIVLVLHDAEPGMVLYQFEGMDSEVSGDFQRIALSSVTSETLFDWMQQYFAG